MWPDQVSNPGPLTLVSDALPTEPRGPAVKRYSFDTVFNHFNCIVCIVRSHYCIVKQEISLKKIIAEGYRAVGSLNDSFQSSNSLLLLLFFDFGQW